MVKRKRVLTQLLVDVADRERIGQTKYGEPLTTFNGRSALQDAYEEALDLAMYLKQRLLEEEDHDRD